MWKRKLWKRKQTRKRLTLYGAGSGSKNILLLPHPWITHNEIIESIAITARKTIIAVVTKSLKHFGQGDLRNEINWRFCSAFNDFIVCVIAALNIFLGHTSFVFVRRKF